MSAAAPAPADAADPPPRHGDFTWYEFLTPDPAAAEAFYGPLVGWHFAPGDSVNQGYRMVLAGSEPVGGVLALTEGMAAQGARPVWIGYVQVDRLAAAVDALLAGGGRVLMEGLAIPGVGPFAMVADPQGAPLYLIEDRSGRPARAFSKHVPTPGTCAWNELAATDPDAAIVFYTGLFGWRQEGAMPMGEHGSYRFLVHGDHAVGAAMASDDLTGQSGWLFYFRVLDIDAAVAGIADGGGTLVHGPGEIPGGDFSLVARDPQGAMFGLVGPRLAQGRA